MAVLLTLLHLGVKNIRIGPKLPAFATPEMVALLVDKYQLTPANTGNPKADVALMMNKK